MASRFRLRAPRAAARRALAALAALALLTAGCREGGASPATIDVTIRGEAFALEPAIDDETRERGLMGRTGVPPGTGMIFIFPDAITRSFWMKDCLTDIDLVFLDARGSVTAIHRMTVEPPRLTTESERDYEARLRPYVSLRPSQFAIELPPGSIDRLGIAVDDRIELDLSRLKALAQ